MRAAIYARISLDREGEGMGVDRQLKDCVEFAAAKGWTVVDQYVDNDVSAFSGAKRPQFERMLLDLANQEIDTVVVWKTDRLARRGKDLQRFLDAAGSATLNSCTEPEFTGATGLLMLRIINGFAEHESGVKSERVARKLRDKAERGDPHNGGHRALGYEQDGVTIIPAEASLIKEAAARILAGESLSAVCLDWQARGTQTVAGGSWAPSNLSRLLRSPRIAGLREHLGQHFDATWPAIIDRPTWERLRASLGQRKHVNGRKWLLTGLLVCGRCGAYLTGGNHSGNLTSYVCRPPVMGGCGRCAIVTSRVEPYVVSAVLAALETAALKQGASDRSDSSEALLEALRASESDLAQLAKDHYVAKLISRPAYLAANEQLESRVNELRRQVAQQQNVLDDLDGATIADVWETKSLSWRQSVLRAALEKVVVIPGLGTRPKLDDRLQLVWRA